MIKVFFAPRILKEDALIKEKGFTSSYLECQWPETA